MNNLKVFSDESKFAQGGEWSCEAGDIDTNFPSCVSYFNADDASNNQKSDWDDRVASSTAKLVPIAAGLTKDSMGVVGSSVTISAPVVLGTSNIFAMVRVRLSGTTGAWNIGDTSTNGISFKPSGGEYATRTATDYLTFTPLYPSISSYPEEVDVGFILPAQTDGTASIQVQSRDGLYRGMQRPTGNLTGTTDGTTTNQLVDSTKDFTALGYVVGDKVLNTTDGTDATLKAVGTTTATLDKDIFVSGEGYSLRDVINGSMVGDYGESTMSIVTSSDARIREIALFTFSSGITEAEMRMAYEWMLANPGKLYPGFAGKT